GRVLDVVDERGQLLREHLVLRLRRVAVEQRADVGAAREQPVVEPRRERIVAGERELEGVAEQARGAHGQASSSEETDRPCFLSRRSRTNRFLRPSALAARVGLRPWSASAFARVSRSSSATSTADSAESLSSASTAGVKPM